MKIIRLVIFSCMSRIYPLHKYLNTSIMCNQLFSSELIPTCKGHLKPIFKYYTTCSHYLPWTKVFMYSDAKCFKYLLINKILWGFFFLLISKWIIKLCIMFMDTCMSTFFRYWPRLDCSMCMKLSLWTSIFLVLGVARLSYAICGWYVSEK